MYIYTGISWGPNGDPSKQLMFGCGGTWIIISPSCGHLKTFYEET